MPERLRFVTAITGDQCAGAASLLRALHLFHPGAPLHVAALDGTSPRELPAGVVAVDPAALHFGALSFDELAPALDVHELRRAVVPALVLHALDTGADRVVYVAPRLAVVGPLDDVIAAAAGGWTVLPRLDAPLPVDGARPDDLDAAVAGAYRDTLVAAARAGRGAIAWWAALAGRGWRRDLPAPALLTLVAAAHPPHAPADRSGHLDAFAPAAPAAGAPIRTIDLSGYDPAAPHRLDARGTEPDRIRPPAVPGHDAAVAGSLPDAGAAPAAAPLVSLSAAAVYDAVMRRLYRRALAAALDGEGTRPPSPRTDPAAFLAWCAGSEIGGPVPVSRYLEELRRGRPDLLDAFPEVPGRDTPGYVEWVHVYGRHEQHLPDALVPAPRPDPAPPPYLQPGVNLAGFLTAALGVGEVARRLATALDAATVPYATVTFARTASRAGYGPRPDGTPRFDTNIVCVNADSLGAFAQTVGPDFFAARHTVGVWFWETADLPGMFTPAFANLDEVWAASDFVADALRAAAPAGVPVVRFPLPIVVPEVDPELDRAALGLPEQRSVFLFSFDYLSVAARKNPFGLIEAFRAAFAPDEGPLLVVKSINGHRRPGDVERLRHLARGRADIDLRDGYVDPAVHGALVAHCDCFVSLHRSEGFGFNIADAVALGRPVIATRYSGSMTFLRDDDCYLVDCTETAVGPGQFPYDPSSRWADPDLDHAARLLRQVAADPLPARERAARARARVLADFAPAVTGRFIRNRLAGVRASRH